MYGSTFKATRGNSQDGYKRWCSIVLVDSLSADGLQFSFSSRMWGAPPRWNHFFRSRARYIIEITPSNAFHLSKGIV